MVSDADYEAAGIPISILGLKWTSWKVDDILHVLNHYHVRRSRHVKKIDLLRRLHVLSQRHTITPRMRIEIVRDARQRRAALISGRIIARIEAANQDQITAPTATSAANVDSPQEVDATPANLSDCSICMETLGLQSYPAGATTSSCNHRINVCAGCLQQSMATQLNSKRWDQINCPSCNEIMSYEDVKRAASGDVFER